MAQMRLARVTAERSVATESARTVNAVLSGEGRRMTAGDVTAWSTDSLAIRAFRGSGLPCGTTTGGVLVRYGGDRMPDATKDSVLIVEPPGESGTVLLDSAPAAGMCPSEAGETVLEWRVAAAVPQGAVLLVFESGSYHLNGRAFRYRIGAGGRQPLTPAALRHPYSRFTGVTSRSIRFQLESSGIRSEFTAPFSLPGVTP
ncbi:MAG: hypothetical protein ACRELT_12185 [Longimicrobiales bacterium]